MPSDYLEQYRSRVNKTSLVEHTKQEFVKMFIGNPNYKVLTIDGIQYETLYSQGSNSDEKTLLFSPNTKINIGSIVEINSNSYLIKDFQGEGINEIYPTAKLQLCNSTYPILTKTKTIKTDAQGKPVLDKFNDPVYTFTETSVSIPCIVKNTFTNVDENKQLPLPQGQLNVTLPYRTDIKVNDTFSMYSNKYKIRNIDFTQVINEKGILTLLVEQVVN